MDFSNIERQIRACFEEKVLVNGVERGFVVRRGAFATDSSSIIEGVTDESVWIEADDEIARGTTVTIAGSLFEVVNCQKREHHWVWLLQEVPF